MAQIAKPELPDLSKLRRRDRDFILQNPSLQAMFSREISLGTAAIYSREVAKFCISLKMPIETAIRFSYDWSAIAGDYIVQTQKTRQLGARRIIVSALNCWFKANGVHLFEPINAPIGKTWKKAPPILSKKQLGDIVQFADLKEKTVLLIAASSGLSARMISELKLKDIQLDKEIPLIRSKNSRSFISPEARATLEAYLRLREKRKEALTDESYLTGSRPIGFERLEVMFQDCLKRAGLNGFSFSALRDYFKSWARVLNVEPAAVDYFTGAKNGIRIHAETPEQDLLNEYKRIIPAVQFFTIDNEADSLKERILNLQTKIEVLRRERDDNLIRYEEQKRMNRTLIKFGKLQPGS